jgi:hypothetical protein
MHFKIELFTREGYEKKSKLVFSIHPSLNSGYHVLAEFFWQTMVVFAFESGMAEQAF